MNKCWIATAFAFALAGTAWAQSADKKPPAGGAAKPATGAPATGGAATGAPAAGAPAAGAAAGGPAAGEMPQPAKPGPETEALKPFMKNMTWTGKVPAGAWGNNPEMPTKGKSTCKWVVNNLFALCEMEDTTGTGKQAMTWKGITVQGWDVNAKGYRATMADSFGTTTEMKGTLENNKLVWESMAEMMMMGQKSKVRVTFDNSDPKAMKMTGEHTVKGKWVVDEENTIKVSAK
jgi:hypothetical protein